MDLSLKLSSEQSNALKGLAKELGGKDTDVLAQELLDDRVRPIVEQYKVSNLKRPESLAAAVQSADEETRGRIAEMLASKVRNTSNVRTDTPNPP